MILNTEAKERVLLASIVNASICSDGLADQLRANITEKAFTSPSRRYIFNSINAIRQINQTADLSMVIDYVTGNDSQMDTDAPNEVSILATIAPQKKIDGIISELLSCQSAREVSNIALSVSQRLESADNIKQEVEAIHRDIQKAVVVSNVTSSGTLLKDLMAPFMKNLENMSKNNTIQGLPLGIKSLDDSMGGLRGGEVLVIAGLPSMGKTAWVISIIAGLVLKNKAVAFFSVEMTKYEVVGRLIPQCSALMENEKEIAYSKIRNPQFLGKKDMDSMRDTIMAIKDKNLFVDDNGRITVDQIRSQCYTLRSQGKLDLIVVDYLQLMVVDEFKSASELSNITGELKRVAKEFNVPVIEVSQLNIRDNSKGRPHLGNLKGSGSLEANADAVIFPWREFVVTRDGDDSEMALLIAKGRAFSGSDIEAHFCTNTMLVSQKNEHSIGFN